jgi:transposase
VLGVDLHRRHQFVWPTFTQRTEDVIAGFEAAWLYFGGVFPVALPDNVASIVVEAENTAPRFNDVFFEHAQSRGFAIDAARMPLSHRWEGRPECPCHRLSRH